MESTEPLECALDEARLEACLALSRAAGWNQNAADWRIFLELGTATAVKTIDGRLAATAATLPYPSGFGWISMVLVAADYRRRGIARALTDGVRTVEADPVAEKAWVQTIAKAVPG